MSQFEGLRDLKVADEKAEVIVKFNDVSKTYTLYRSDQERFKALFFKPKNTILHKGLDHVNLEIRKGEAVGIIGDNGSGKSTLLKTITGVTFPDEGNVEVKGMVAALLELTAGFSTEMTGRENIYLKGYILGLNDDEIKDIEERVIDFAELGDYIDQPVRTYSSGMKMRLGFAININIEPDILVIDEALSVGDASFKTKCKNQIKEVIQNSNVTVLYVSHNAASVKEICPRSVYLKNGHIMFDGSTEEAQLVYLVDKREMQIERVTNRINKFEEILKAAKESGDTNSIKVFTRKIEKNRVRLQSFCEDLEVFKENLADYREEHYGKDYVAPQLDNSSIMSQVKENEAKKINYSQFMEKTSRARSLRNTAIAACLVVALGIAVFFSVKNAKIDFNSVRNEIGAPSEYCTIAQDDSYMTIDTNPDNIAGLKNPSGMKLVESANEALGLPSSFYSKMKKTKAKDGTIKYDYSRLVVSWSRSSDTGLEVTYYKK